MIGWLDRYFKVRQKGSSVQVECLAGVSTFLALSYIFVVNPAILSQAGISRSCALFATILVAATATIVMGLWARLPFVLAPGMEINGFVAFYVVGTLGFGWQKALGAVFWSGVIFVVLTALRLREKIIGAIPERMKIGLSLCVGVFLCLIALRIAGLLIYDGMTFRAFGNPLGPAALPFYLSLALILLLERFRVRGSVLISVVATAVFCEVAGVGAVADAVAMHGGGGRFENFGGLDLKVILDPAMWGIILILFLVDFYGSIAKLIGIAQNTNLLSGGRLPRMREALLIDGAATMLGSVFGTSSIVVYVESAVGIGARGRTGLTALVCGLLMLSTFLAAPLIESIPVTATAGALVFVALKLCPTPKEMLGFPRLDLLVLAVMPVIIIFTCSLDQAMLAGFVLYAARDIVAMRAPNPYLVGSIACLVFSLLLRIRGGH